MDGEGRERCEVQTGEVALIAVICFGVIITGDLQTTCCSIPAPYDLPRILRYSGYNEGHEARASKHKYLCVCLCMPTPDGCSRYRAAHGEDICGRVCRPFFPNADGQHSASESINIPAGCTQCFERYILI